jgi:transposase
MRVLIATRPVDFRKGMDGLAAVVKEHLRVDPFSGAIFVFRARRADRVKLRLGCNTYLVVAPQSFGLCGASTCLRSIRHDDGLIG